MLGSLRFPALLLYFTVLSFPRTAGEDGSPAFFSLFRTVAALLTFEQSGYATKLLDTRRPFPFFVTRDS